MERINRVKSLFRADFLSFTRRFGATTLLVMFSQGISAGSLFSLPALGFGVSDVYSIGVQVGTGPFNGIVLGVVYLLAIGRPGFSQWKTCNVFVCAFSIVLLFLALALVGYRIKSYSLPPYEIATILVFYGIGGSFLAVTGVRAVREACLGRPYLLAGSTIIPNACMAITTFLLVFSKRHGLLVGVMPAAVWMLASVGLGVLALSWRMPIPTRPLADGKSAVDTRNNKLAHALGLGIGVITSTAFPIAFVSAISHLEPGSATLLFIASRIGSALIGVLVNSALLVRHSWNGSHRTLDRSPVVLASIGLCLGAGALLMHVSHVGEALSDGKLVSYSLVMLAWLSCSAATPVVLREINVRRMGSTVFIKSVIDIFITSGTTIILFVHPSVTGFFSVTLISQCVTCVVCGVALKERSIVYPSIGSFFVALLLLLLGW